MVPVLTACILGPEPGFQFEARHGTHAREVAAQALLKLCCGTAETRSDFAPVAATAMNGAMHSSFVTALVAEGFRRCAPSPSNSPERSGCWHVSLLLTRRPLHLGRLEAAVAATPSRVQARLHELLLRSGFEGQVRADPFWAQGEAMY